jgi:hypothetical protein
MSHAVSGDRRLDRMRLTSGWLVLEIRLSREVDHRDVFHNCNEHYCCGEALSFKHVHAEIERN